MKNKKDHLILLLILFIGLLIRTILFYNKEFIGTDAASLTRLGWNLVAGGHYSFGENYNWGLFFPPAYPALTGSLNLLINDLFISGKIISLTASTTTIFLFYLLGKELISREAGLFAALVFALHPSIVRTSSWTTTEALFFCLVLTSVYLILVSRRRSSLPLYAAIGIFISASYLTRPEGVLLFLPLLIIHWKSILKSRELLLRLSVTFLLFLIVASPYLHFIKNSTDRYALSGKSSYLAVLLDAGVTESGLKYDKAVYSIDKKTNRLNGLDPHKHLSPSKFFLNNPMVFIKGYMKNMRKETGILLKLLLPILIPLCFAFKSREIFRGEAFIAAFLFPVLLFLIYPGFFILERHMYTITLFIILLSSIGFSSSVSALSGIIRSLRLEENTTAIYMTNNIKKIIVLIFVTACMFGALKISLFTEKEIPAEHMRAGYFLKENVSSEYEQLNVMHRMPWTSFYSGARFTMMPYAHYNEIIKTAIAYNVDFIVVDERSTLSEWEWYSELLHLDDYSDDIELFYEDNSEKLIKLYRVKKTALVLDQ